MLLRLLPNMFLKEVSRHAFTHCEFLCSQTRVVLAVLELVECVVKSRVRSLEQLKDHRVEGLMYFKYVEAQNPPLSLVYADKPQTLDHLEDNIRRGIADIWPQMLEKVIENWTSRLDYIRASRGSPMPEIIFKM
ncbi:hypothetical protein TNCV_1576611 [Trichonephila clavipes]|nr:hypothetical protein TNCV_1576611 [Trichonephila clavipes]